MSRQAIERASWWLRDNWKAILLVLGLTALFIAVGIGITRNHDLTAIEAEGEVVRFGAYSSKEGPLPVVVVQMADGRVVQLRAHRSQTHHCRPGSTIELVRRGDMVLVAPRGCAPPAP